MKRLLFGALVICIAFSSCGSFSSQQKSDSGAVKASTTVSLNEQGRTVEQENIIKRLERDNNVGSMKFIYVISAYTGDVLEASTVIGKVTSGGKRLSPKTVSSSVGSSAVGVSMNTVNIAGTTYATDEVLDDGGAYGESGQYLFWFDANDKYHQYYPSGGTYLHISDGPLRVRKANFTFSETPLPVVDTTKTR